MRLWIDDVRPAPEGYIWCTTVDFAKKMIQWGEIFYGEPEILDMDHDAGEYAQYGGDYIKLMDWLVERGTLYPLAFHSQNCVGMENMKRMYRRYWLKESL